MRVHLHGDCPACEEVRKENALHARFEDNFASASIAALGLCLGAGYVVAALNVEWSGLAAIAGGVIGGAFGWWASNRARPR